MLAPQGADLYRKYMAEVSSRLHVVGVAGSATRAGNSDRLLDEALRGAGKEGAHVERVVAAELAIEPCRACDACRNTGRCIINSKAEEVHDKLRAADAVVLSSPVYFGGLPAQLKALIDRTQVQHWAWLARGAPPPSRPALLLTVAGRPHMNAALAGIRTTAAAWLAVLGFQVWQTQGYPGLDTPDAAASQASILAELEELGRDLARAAAKRRRDR
ncbi:MAG: flavodoxin family protein [Candidatus Bipolaricaulota bacterium]